MRVKSGQNVSLSSTSAGYPIADPRFVSNSSMCINLCGFSLFFLNKYSNSTFLFFFIGLFFFVCCFSFTSFSFLFLFYYFCFVFAFAFAFSSFHFLLFSRKRHLRAVVANGGAFWFYCPPMFTFMILVNQIVSEKENKLRMGMRIMGLKDSMFWLSWFLTAAVIQVLFLYCFLFSSSSSSSASFILVLYISLSLASDISSDPVHTAYVRFGRRGSVCFLHQYQLGGQFPHVLSVLDGDGAACVFDFYFH